MGLHTEAVKRKIRILCIVFLGAVLSAAAIFEEVSTVEEQRNPGGDTLAAGAGDIRTDTGIDEEQGSPGEYTPPAELCYVETDAEQEGNELVFGNLVIELPEGVIAEMEAANGADSRGRQLINLVGAETLIGDAERYDGTGPFPPQIGMARYTAEYECEEALICALLTLFPGGNLRSAYGNTEKKEYIFRIGQGKYNEGYYTYAIVHGEDMYLVSEFDEESGYSFSALRQQGRIKWRDSGRMLKSNTDATTAWFMITPEEGMSLLCHDCSSNLFFYLEGYFDNSYVSYQTGRNGGHIYSDDLEDINFDGCTDISIGSQDVLIWDSNEKEYVYVEYPADMPYSWDREIFPETGTIWSCDNDYNPEKDNINDRDYIESLWQWDGFVPVKKRECRAELRRDGVRLWAYEDTADNILFDESFAPEEWDKDNNTNIRALYRQFYDGLVPKDASVSGETHNSDGQEKIPQGLLDKIIAALMSGTEVETLKPMMVSTELSDEECYEAVRKSEDIRVNILENESYILARADVDNDGTEDIIGEFYWGGSGGFVSYILFQGQADGTYIETDSFESVKEEFGIIGYDGKNYLIRTTYDYAKKFINGFAVAVFEEGNYMEEVQLTLYAEDYELAVADSEEAYEAMAGRVMGKAVSYDGMVEEYETIVGSAEEPAKDIDEYMCDLDNDGEMEYYDKHIWTTSNMYTRDSLAFDCEDETDEGIALLRKAIQERWLDEDFYNDIMLWADEADGETVVNVMYQTSLEDFVIVGYVIGGSECRIVYEITADAVLGVSQTRYARNGRGADGHWRIA